MNIPLGYPNLLRWWPVFVFTSLGAFIGMIVAPSLADLESAVLWVVVASTILAVSAGTYLLVNPSFDRAVHLMMLTLPMLSALVIDIGGSVRVTYLFTLLAIFFAVFQDRFSVCTRGLPLLFLHAFVVYALVSTSYTLAIPDLEPVSTVGFRGSVFRSFIQFGQLLLMVATIHVILNYAKSLEDLERLCNLIFWATLLATVYGFYEFFAYLFDFPFVSLITASLDSPEGPMSLSRRLVEDLFARAPRNFGGILLPRPRSFMREAQWLTTYLLFSIPFSVIAAMRTKAQNARWTKILCVFTFIILFILTNSRSGFIAVVGLLFPLLILALNWQMRLRLIITGLAGVLLFSFMLLPGLGTRGGLGGLWEFIVSTYNFSLSMQGRVGFFHEPLKVFLMSPVFGVGIGNYQFYLAYKSYGSSVATIGNLYLNVLTELGIVGGFLFLGFIGSTVRGLVRVLRRTNDLHVRGLAFAAVISIVGVMISLIASSGLYTNSYIWVMWAMSVAITRLHSHRVSRG